MDYTGAVDLAGAADGVLTTERGELNSVGTKVGDAEGNLPCWYAEVVTDFLEAAAGDDCSYDIFGLGHVLEALKNRFFRRTAHFDETILG